MLGDGELAAQIAKLAIKMDRETIPTAAWVARAVAIDPFDERGPIAHADSREPRFIFAAVVDRQYPMMQTAVRVMAVGADENAVCYLNRIHKGYAAPNSRRSAVRDATQRLPFFCAVLISPALNRWCV